MDEFSAIVWNPFLPGTFEYPNHQVMSSPESHTQQLALSALTMLGIGGIVGALVAIYGLVSGTITI